MKEFVEFAALGLSAWAFYSFGYRLRWTTTSVLVLLALVAIAVASQVLLPAPAYAGIQIAAYLIVVVLVIRETPWLVRRTRARSASIRFIDTLMQIDSEIWRAYRDPPLAADNGIVLIDENRERLRLALEPMRVLRPPTGPLADLTRERIALHEAYIAILASPTPVGPDVTEPLREHTDGWRAKLDAVMREESVGHGGR